MKQTAVDWLVEQLKGNNMLTFDEWTELFEQAKQLEEEQNFQLGKRCFYKGFEKAKNDDGNCFTSWREEAPELLTFKSE